jgi:hypothetical protein
VFGLYAWTIGAGVAPPQARAATFLALVLANLFLALGNAFSRSARLVHRGHALFLAIASAALLITLAAIYVPAVSGLFLFAAIPLQLVLFAVAAGVTPGMVTLLARRMAPT